MKAKKIEKAFAIVWLSSLFMNPVLCFAQETEDDIHFLGDKERQELWAQEVVRQASAEAAEYSAKQRYSKGSWSWRDGLICVTDSFSVSSIFNNGHAGIVAAAPYYEAVIESNPGEGVQAKLGAWPTRTGFNHVYQAGVKSTTIAQDQQAAIWAGHKIGKPYELKRYMLESRNSFYCSHLVYSAYKDTCGIDLDTTAWSGYIHPLELLSSPQTETIYEFIRE